MHDRHAELSTRVLQGVDGAIMETLPESRNVFRRIQSSYRTSTLRSKRERTDFWGF